MDSPNPQTAIYDVLASRALGAGKLHNGQYAALIEPLKDGSISIRLGEVKRVPGLNLVWASGQRTLLLDHMLRLKDISTPENVGQSVQEPKLFMLNDYETHAHYADRILTIDYQESLPLPTKPDLSFCVDEMTEAFDTNLHEPASITPYFYHLATRIQDGPDSAFTLTDYREILPEQRRTLEKIMQQVQRQ